MAKRELTPAELAQRRAAAKNAGRPARFEGTRAARRAVREARLMGRNAQAEAAAILIAGMRGELPPETAEAQMSSAKQILSRWGNPPLKQVEQLGDKRPDVFVFGVSELEQKVPAHQPAPAPPEKPADAGD
jgi:hypothetical protein